MPIRPMTLTDLPAVNELDRLSFSLAWPEGAFAAEMRNPNARCWVLTEGNQVQAALVLWRVLDEAHIATVAVHPAARRRGLGRQIIRAAMDAAIVEGARIFHLEVRAGNDPALALYEQFGFEVVGRREKYYMDNGEDALLMTLRLEKTEEA